MRGVRLASAGVVALTATCVTFAAPELRREAPAHAVPPPDVRPAAARAFRELPLLFEQNRGQTDRRAAFLARANGFTAFLTKRGPVLSLVEPIEAGPRPDAQGHRRFSPPPRARSAALFVEFVGARPSLPEGLERGRAIATYFGPGRIDAPTFGRALQRSVYPGIDVLYRGDGGDLRYDWLVSPGADPSRIALELGGADAVRVTRAGALVVTVDGLTLRQSPPAAYQRIEGERHPVAARWSLRDGHATFALGRYDRARPLVIDPTLQAVPGFSLRYVGGADVEAAIDIDWSSINPPELLLGGFTNSSDFPGSTGNTQRYDAFLAGVNMKDGLTYSFTIRGPGNDSVDYVKVIDSTRVFFAGATQGGLPVTRAFDPFFGGGTCEGQPCYDTFVGVFDPSSRQLSSLGYWGGNRDDAVGGGFQFQQNVVEVFGSSGGGTFPSDIPFQGGPNDATYTRWEVRPDGRLVCLESTFLGGPGSDGIHGGLFFDRPVTLIVGGGSSQGPGAPLAPAFWISTDNGANWTQRIWTGGTSPAYFAWLVPDGDRMIAGVNGLLPGTDAGECTPNACSPVGVATFDWRQSLPPEARFAPLGLKNLFPPRLSGLLRFGEAFGLRLPRRPLRAAAAVEYLPSISADVGSAQLWSLRLDANAPPVVEKQETVGTGTALVTGVTATPDGTVYVTGAAVPGSFPGVAVKGPADAFVAEFAKFLVPCNCTAIDTTASGYGDISSPRRGTRVSFRVKWEMACAAGDGPCAGEIRVVGPGGDVRITQPKRQVSCRGTCRGLPVEVHGRFTVQATSASTLDPEKRAGKRFVYKLQKWCIVDGKRVVKRAGSVVVVYNQFGSVDRKKSDLNGNGRPDAKDKKK